MPFMHDTIDNFSQQSLYTLFRQKSICETQPGNGSSQYSGCPIAGPDLFHLLFSFSRKVPGSYRFDYLCFLRMIAVPPASTAARITTAARPAIGAASPVFAAD